MNFCEIGKTCAGCPVAELDIDLGSEVALAVTDTIRKNDQELFVSGSLAAQKVAVKESSRFFPWVMEEGAPYMIVVGAARRISRGKCSVHNISNEGDNE